MTKVVFIDKELEDTFNKLDSSDPIKKALIRAIQTRSTCRKKCYKKTNPKTPINKYGVENLRIYNLPTAWRMIYTVTSNEIEVIAVILDWMNHKNYERLFKFS